LIIVCIGLNIQHSTFNIQGESINEFRHLKILISQQEVIADY